MDVAISDTQYVYYIRHRILNDLGTRLLEEESVVNKAKAKMKMASMFEGPAKKMTVGLAKSSAENGMRDMAQTKAKMEYWNKAIKILTNGPESQKVDVRAEVDVEISNEQARLEQARVKRKVAEQKAAEEARQEKTKRLKEIRSQPLSDKNRWVSVLLAVFLGFVGAEYFYMRRFVSAGVQLACLAMFLCGLHFLAMSIGLVMWIVGIFREIDGNGKWMAFDQEDVKKRDEEKIQLERELGADVAVAEQPNCRKLPSEVVQ